MLIYLLYLDFGQFVIIKFGSTYNTATVFTSRHMCNLITYTYYLPISLSLLRPGMAGEASAEVDRERAHHGGRRGFAVAN